MIANIFAAIQLFLKLIGLWEEFLSFTDKQRIAEGEKKRQERQKAIDDLSTAKTDEEIFDAQERIINSKP